MTKIEALEVMDGLLMGDFGIHRYRRGACGEISLSKILAPKSSPSQDLLREKSLTDHMKWLQWITDNVFPPLGIEACTGHPRIATKVRSTGKHKGEVYRYAHLATHNSSSFEELYNEWYIGGEWVQRKQGTWYVRGATKKLPERIMQASTLPIPVLVQEFLGDGSSSRYHYKDQVYTVYISFSTQCFTSEEVYHLMGMLNNMSILTVKPYYDKRCATPGLTIILSQTAENTNRFMDLIEPGILEIFGDSESPSYKGMIKRR